MSPPTIFRESVGYRRISPRLRFRRCLHYTIIFGGARFRPFGNTAFYPAGYTLFTLAIRFCLLKNSPLWIEKDEDDDCEIRFHFEFEQVVSFHEFLLGFPVHSNYANKLYSNFLDQDKNGLNQQKLENCDPEGKAADFREVLTHASEDRLCMFYLTLESCRFRLFKKREFVYRLQLSNMSLCFRESVCLASTCISERGMILLSMKNVERSLKEVTTGKWINYMRVSDLKLGAA
ncbi:hypothetical protein YC2023_072602 [Brassica napus]